MKKMKKLSALIVALVMILVTGFTALAADNGSITVKNPDNNTYKAYKILDVTYNENQTAFAYTIKANSEWFEVVNNYAGLKLTEAKNGDEVKTYVVDKMDSFSAPEFSKHLLQSIDDKTGIELNNGNEVATVSDLPLGYYLVDSSAGALCNLTTTTPNAEIYDKNDVVFAKTDNKDTVQVGDIVNYVITGNVPNTTGFEEYVYKFTDSMSTGLTFNEDVTVKVADEKLDEAYYTYKKVGNGFELSIEVMELQSTIDAEIKVEYSATVNENAVAKVENNSATLTYSNDPTGEKDPVTTPPDEETVYSAKIVIDKHGETEATKLAGAQFVLRTTDDDDTKYYATASNATPENPTGWTVTWVEDLDDAAKVITDEKGAASFDGLKDGTYYLEEIEAPDGYNLLVKFVEVKVDGEDSIKEVSSELTQEEIATNYLTDKVSVQNTSGTLLPGTGGIGTTMFYVIGGVLVLAAMALVALKSRMKTED